MNGLAKVLVAMWLSFAVMLIAVAASDAFKHDAEARKAEALAKSCSCPDGGAR